MDTLSPFLKVFYVNVILNVLQPIIILNNWKEMKRVYKSAQESAGSWFGLVNQIQINSNFIHHIHSLTKYNMQWNVCVQGGGDTSQS